MALLTCLVLSLLGARVVLASAPTEGCRWQTRQNCPKCRPGEFQTKCKCAPCPPGTFTSVWNCEASCHRCYRDCTPELHLTVAKNCSDTSNLRCECEEGFRCVDRDSVSGNCKRCQRIPLPATTAATWTQPCSFPKCGPEERKSTKHLIVILCPLLTVGCVALVLVFCLGCPGHRTRFKQAVKKLCSVEAKEAVHVTGQTSSEKQQAVPVATANMGPVHVHNPGTVIFSLLGEFMGQIGETKEERTDVRHSSGDEEYCTVCQPTPSPSVPLSKEEHPGELNSVFFPSQEQGKDSRVSMEEQL